MNIGRISIEYREPNMKYLLFISLFVTSLSFYLPSPAYAQGQGQGQGNLGETIMEEGPIAPRREEAPPEYEGAPIPPEDLEMEQEETGEPAAEGQPQPPKPPATAEGAAREGEEARQIVIDALVNLNYVFNNSPDSFMLKYHVHLEGRVAAATAVLKGNSSINTEVTGFLAKWPTGECKLNVTVPDSPFEMTFRKTAEDRAMVDLKFPNPISENWDSQCSFKDAPDAKFNTKGDPEKWLAKAFEKARPPLTRLTVNLNPEESTTMKFEISKQTIKDPPLGSAEVDGTGVITINPGAGG